MLEVSAIIEYIHVIVWEKCFFFPDSLVISFRIACVGRNLVKNDNYTHEVLCVG